MSHLFVPYANNKDTDQPVHPRSLINTFVVCCLDSIISLVSIFTISSLYIASVAAQASLCLTWSETPKTGSHDEAHMRTPLRRPQLCKYPLLSPTGLSTWFLLHFVSIFKTVKCMFIETKIPYVYFDCCIFFLICHLCVAWDLLKIKCPVMPCYVYFTVNKVKLTSLSFRVMSCRVMSYHVMSISVNKSKLTSLCSSPLTSLFTDGICGWGGGWYTGFGSEMKIHICTGTAGYVHSWTFRSWWSTHCDHCWIYMYYKC